LVKGEAEEAGGGMEPTEEHSNEFVTDHVVVVTTVLPQGLDKDPDVSSTRLVVALFSAWFRVSSWQ
jgi:hypothetical protein